MSEASNGSLNVGGWRSQLIPQQATTQIDAFTFAVRQILNRAHTATLVKVLSCTNAGDVSPVGRVDVQPLVDQLDGALNAVAHAPIYDVPYQRIQGGTNAVIIDPQPGDIGIAVFADRDISTVKASGSRGAPASARSMDMADALFLPGALNAAPAQYVRLYGGGVEIVSPVKIRLAAPEIEIAADASLSITAPGGDVVVQTISLVNHVHGGVTSGGSTTDVPQ
ncbi:MAG: oxidoreductase [Burkholderiaceae bacterium]|jgi:hypothetical protein|nr:oxidoreductase [Burkholderiaceae bacterium]